MATVRAQCKEDLLRGDAVTFIVLDGTRVRSAMRMLKRMTRHMGPTSPFQVYLGMYSGMCVWYDTCNTQSLCGFHLTTSLIK